MAGKLRSSEGCWTCRLRRKKCDEIRPICQACGALEIQCYYSESKPEWMDGAEKQREMSDHVKRQVKVQANQRREKRYLQNLGSEEHDDSDEYVSVPSDYVGDADCPNASSTYGSTSMSPDALSANLETPAGSSGGSAFQLDAVMSTITEIAPSISTSSLHATPEESLMEGAEDDCETCQVPPINDADSFLEDERDMHFVVIYLDYVFPFLFPFYRPALLEGGRGWLMTHLKTNKALYHSALSLSSYFFSVVLETVKEGRGPCQETSIHQLQEQQDLALRTLQADMAAINVRGVQGYVRHSSRVLESIIQLLVFDVALGNAHNWQMHLDAAIFLFESIIPQPDQWVATLESLGSSLVDRIKIPKDHHRPWTTDQAAFRFFTSILLVIDVISATTLERAPRLTRYYATVLEKHKENELRTMLQLELEDVFGCQSWVYQLIGEISALDAWKKENKKAGSLSMTQLVSRGAQIEMALRDGIACLNSQCPREQHSCTEATMFPSHCLDPHPPHSKPSKVKDLFSLFQRGSAMPGTGSDNDVMDHTRIMAQSALTYLFVVLSGWQPSCPEISESVAATAMLLRQLTNPISLRTLSWAFCVTGCLAPQAHESCFREMVNGMGTFQIFGTIHKALEIMENVWARRDSLNESFDLAAALKGLGPAAILI